MSIDDNEQQVAEPTVRLCMLRTWPKHFDGYGFNLHAEKSKSSAAAANGSAGTAAAAVVALPFSGGQFVGKVDRGSPAESAGLREGDRIVQVDGMDIEGETHSKVVGRIKKGSAAPPPPPDESAAADQNAAADPDAAVSRCSLLVVDRRADTYYKENGIRVHANMGLQVLVLRTPEDPTPECLSLPQNANASSPPKSTAASTPAAAAVDGGGAKQQNDSDDTAKTTNSTTSTTTLNLNMTAAELRRRLAERKKHDSRRSGGNGDGSLDFRKKYEIVDKL